MKQKIEEITERITEYLSVGGLFNPEMMNHDKVRDILIDCRDALTELLSNAEGEVSTGDLASKALEEFEKNHNPFYPDEMKWSRTSLLHLCIYAVKSGLQASQPQKGV